MLLRCDQENRHTPLHPFHEYFLQRFAAQDDAAGNVAEDLEPRYARAMESLGYRIGLDKITSRMLADYFANLRGSVSDEPAMDTLIAPLSNVVLHGDAPTQPLLVMVDDIQWADAATRALLNSLLQNRRRDPVMILLCGRDMNLPVPIDETITMPPLRRDAMVQLVSCRGKDIRLSPKLRRRIVEKARGVPLYAEQMVQLCPSSDIEDEPSPLILDLLAARAVYDREEDSDVVFLPKAKVENEFSMPFLEAD
jgi:hypothetical protein